MDETPNLGLPYIMAAQAQKHVTHNEAIRALDAIVQINVLDRDLAAPPASPNDGDRYIVAAGASGAWTAKENQLAAYQDGLWVFYPPGAGWIAWVNDEVTLYAYDGAAWGQVASGGGGSVNPTPLVGVNATADTSNRLSVSSPAVLFNHEGAGHQVKINKAAAGDTGTVLFQTGFSGRAEMGLAGDDDYHFKVSPDGTNWTEALSIDRTTGLASLAADPVAALGAATKQYVDVNGGGASIAFDYQTASDQSITANGTWQKLTGFSVPRVTDAGFNTSNSRFTVTVAGPYMFLGQIVQVMGGALGNQFGSFAKNGSPLGNSIVHLVLAAAQDFMFVSTILDLAVGDFVEFHMFAQGDTTINLGFTSFGGTKL